ncbi:MAG: SH3 domain-containing protein [Oscillospiraceae bacterium]|nr:SH3 domain-containing protein [Oscillospiraceae bacterium]
MKIKTIIIIAVSVTLVAITAFLGYRILYLVENPELLEVTLPPPVEEVTPPDGPPDFPVVDEPEHTLARVNASGGLRMREGPGVDYEIILLIPDFDQVLIHEEESGWVYIEYGEVSGWASGEFLIREDDPRFALEPVESVVTPGNRSPNPASARISAQSGLRMRMGPSSDYHVVMVIGYDELVRAHDEQDGWVYIEHLGHWGWVSAEYITNE